MLEKLNLSLKAGKEEYKALQQQAGARLGELQRAYKEAGIPVILVFEGVDAAGKGMQINRLIQDLDPRGFAVYAGRSGTEEERLRPFLWRFWTKTPGHGRIAVFDESWYRSVLVDRFEGRTTDEALEGAYQDILSFEQQLSVDGTVIIKLFLYISKDEQKKRFKKLERSEETAWRVTKTDWQRNQEYDRFLSMNEEMLQRTDTDIAPWTIIEATDKNYASMKILTVIVERLADELKRRSVSGQKVESQADKPAERCPNQVLAGADLSLSLTKEEYKEQLDKLQKKVEFLHSELYRLKIPVVLGFEGWDAGGKGGAIKRLTSRLDPRGYKVNPTAAPNDLEKQHHYLWRFWMDVPKAGHIAIFDRTWYGRVMVERIEGFCTEHAWKRAYQEINEMESHLANSGAVVLKFWLQIDKDEQERRFKERSENPEKQWKITEEDWRNREKWDQYEEAVNEMLVRTSTTYASWIIVEGNCKYYARIKVLRTVVEALESKIAEVKKEQKKKSSSRRTGGKG